MEHVPLYGFTVNTVQLLMTSAEDEFEYSNRDEEEPKNHLASFPFLSFSYGLTT
jgi:hypothetical protein